MKLFYASDSNVTDLFNSVGHIVGREFNDEG